ncbi:hypothetical protein M514_00740, partial [Trichuris suis]
EISLEPLHLLPHFSYRHDRWPMWCSTKHHCSKQMDLFVQTQLHRSHQAQRFHAFRSLDTRDRTTSLALCPLELKPYKYPAYRSGSIFPSKHSL